MDSAYHSHASQTQVVAMPVLVLVLDQLRDDVVARPLVRKNRAQFDADAVARRPATAHASARREPLLSMN